MTPTKRERLVEAIREVFDDEIDEDTSLILMNIIFVNDIYFSETSGVAELDWAFETTHRAAGEIVTEVLKKGNWTEEDAANLVGIYSRKAKNIYELSPRLEALREQVQAKLLEHPWIDKFVRTV